jgi:DNA replicative helicase MCM subunit Mcm2 (Cdc46/Mcm family)
MKQEQNIFEKSNIFQSDSKAEVLTQYFLKKYINYCKQNVFPILSDDSI